MTGDTPPDDRTDERTTRDADAGGDPSERSCECPGERDVSARDSRTSGAPERDPRTHDAPDRDPRTPDVDAGDVPRDASIPRATDGGIDADPAGDASADAATVDTAAIPEDSYDPVDVFPDSEGMDLRPGADACYKCSTCDTNCPVAEVDDEFPGPKFQGPEQWRLTREDASEIDPSVEKCSNCMRCDHACPTDVPLSQMHNTARGRYVDEQLSRFSITYLRKKILSNYGRLGRVGATFPRVTNVLLGNRLLRWAGDRFFGVTNEREFPTFARQTFRSWWDERGGAQIQSEERRVAYFHGDYANYNTPEVGKALVRTFEHFGYEVAVPPQRCSGTPMFANGMLEDARRAAEVNVGELSALIEEGYDVVCSCTSCSLALRQEYPELFDVEGTDDVAANTYEAVEYLRIHEDLEGALADADADVPDLAYHAPCHARNQGLAEQALEVGDAIDGVDVHDVGDSCSGISGTYGWKSKHYETSMAIGEEMFHHMEAVDADTGMTECPTCSSQMEHGTGMDVRHPLELIAAALGEEVEPW